MIGATRKQYQSPNGTVEKIEVFEEKENAIGCL